MSSLIDYNVNICVITVHHVPKCMSCHKAIVVITRRAHCFHDQIYITPILLYIIHGFLLFYSLLKVKTYSIKMKKNGRFLNMESYSDNRTFFLIGIHSMKDWTATTRHGDIRKRSPKRLKHIGNLSRKNLQLKMCRLILRLKAT